MYCSSLLPADVFGNPHGPVLFFVHGFLGSGRDWDELATRLEYQYQIVAVDLPGHGLARDMMLEEYQVETIARNIAGLLEKFRPPITLVGYSMGGRVALATAVNFPKLVSNLVLVSSSPGLRTAKEREDRRASDERLAIELEKTGMRAFVDQWYQEPLFQSLGEQPDVLNYLRESRSHNQVPGIANSLRLTGTGSQQSYWEALPTLSVPTLLVTGALDTKYEAIARQMADLCPVAQQAIIEKSGHAVLFEQPDCLAAAIQEFVKA